MLYFAYGSNLNIAGMKRRCPAARPVGVAVLRGYRLCFRRYADIAVDAEASVPGALWELTPACVRALDAYEGADYPKIKISVEHDGKAVEAMAYTMNGAKPFAPPSMDYYREVAVGYRDWKLDEKILRRARYDTLNVGPALSISTKAPSGPQTTARVRRGLWDPAAQTSGDLDNLIKPARPRKT
ncbi:MAG: gamma-glutamylcyclotransferase family protein [Rhodospirillaceae bacterium]|nr:gamma-glutamylcyclotransferase family protein [Rhodospirillaceae bacterium]